MASSYYLLFIILLSNHQPLQLYLHNSARLQQSITLCSAALNITLASCNANPPLPSWLTRIPIYHPASSFPYIAILVGSTTRRILSPHFQSLALFSYLLPSIARTVECGFKYAVVLGFDEGDAFYDNTLTQKLIRSWFIRQVSQPLAARGIPIKLIPVRVHNPRNKPGPVFRQISMAAYLRGADYFFRITDDTELLTPWTSRLVHALSTLTPPYGVAGPMDIPINASCPQDCPPNKRLTHDFVHRTHLEVFSMEYYPEELPDWWCDDWISIVYGRNRTMVGPEVVFYHRTKSHGVRYNVSSHAKRNLNRLIMRGKRTILQWMKSNRSPIAVMQAFVLQPSLVFEASPLPMTPAN